MLSFRGHPSLVVYITCGDPDLSTSEQVALAAIRGGAEVIELGVPFSDPVADGPVIQRASERALTHATTLHDVLEVATRIREKTQAGLIIFSYLNPILRFGVAPFAEACSKAGVDGALITDLPVEEATEYVAEMRRRNLATVFLAAPTSPDERLKRIAQLSTGFVYAVARTGVTGTRQELSADARQLVSAVRKFTKLPIAVGFGISTPEQFRAVGEFADAAVIGSAIVEIIESNPGCEADAVAEFIRQLSAFSSQMSVRRANSSVFL